MFISHYYNWETGFSTDRVLVNGEAFTSNECRIRAGGHLISHVYECITGPLGWAIVQDGDDPKIDANGDMSVKKKFIRGNITVERT